MLKPVDNSDLEKILQWRNAPEVRKNMYTTHEISKEEHKQWFENVLSDHSKKYFICSRKNIDYGVIGFTDYRPERKNSSWAFYSSPHAPKGAGIFMEYEALGYAFEVLNVHKLNCEVISFNKSVINLHQKVGFVQEGVLRDCHFDGKCFHDVVCLGMKASEWPDAKAKLESRLSKVFRD